MAGAAALSGTQRMRTVAHALAFVLGLSAVFTLIWMTVALAGLFLAAQIVFWLQRVGGLLLVVLGMQMLGLIRIPVLARGLDLRLEGGATGLPRSLLIGLAFGIGFTPCAGPYLGVILNLLIGQDLVSRGDLASGAVLLIAYVLGLGVPFVLLASGLGAARGAARALANHIRLVNVAGGTLVIVMGLVLASGQFARLAGLFGFLPLLG
jgi:cytochrome c-type biogenesis protein